MGVLRRHLTLALGILGALLLTSSSALAQSREYELKAVFLLHFTRFVKWPASALPAGAPFTIGIVGGDPFGGALDRAVQNETVSGRKIVVRHGGDMSGCQIVFMSKSSGSPSAVSGPGILIVGESAGFARQGGIIEFTLKGNAVNFIINAEAAQKAGLRISSKLLKLGRASASN